MALLDGAEEVTVVSRFKGEPQMDDASSAMTGDSGKESYNSSWTSRLANFHVEADIPKEVLQGLQPNPGPRISAQSPAKKDSYAQVASRTAHSSTVSPSLATPSIPSPQKFPTGPNTQLRVAARTENGKSGGPSGITSGCAKDSPRHPCPNTYRAARVFGSPTCSRSSKPPIGIHALTSCSTNEQHGRHIWDPIRSPETTNCGPHLPTAKRPVHKSQSVPTAKAL
jgi:hypothetical protein